MIKKLVVSASVAVVVLLLALNNLFEHHLDAVLNVKQTSFVEVEAGSTIHSFSKLLVKNTWLDNRFWLRNYVRLHPELSRLKKGLYQVKPGMTVRQLIESVVRGKEHQFSITFIEGTTLKQWLSLLSQQAFVKQKLDNKSVEELAKLLNIEQSNPEGWFYPDTYLYTANTSDIEILKRAHVKMKNELEHLWAQRINDLPYNNKYEALILASIVEKESGKVEEQPTIASVFVNRLNKKMRLQTDPTVIYGLGERYQGDIKRSHLKEKTLYNTYRINGLPPTPIAMPGKTALMAVLNPITSDFLYFVGKGNGFHKFSTNLSDHNKAVYKYQLNKS